MLLEKYNSTWIQNFVEIKMELDRGLVDLNYFIEHIGSTAVPDLDAKPIIDLDIIYETALEFEKIKSGLIKLGYNHHGDQGIPEREVFKRNGIIKNEVLDAITHHLYVCPKNSQALERHLLSRDFLQKHKWAREKYQQMKYDIAKEVEQDKKRYAELKELIVNDFIDDIIEQERREKGLLQKKKND